jgi:hypothetical protein
MADKNLQCSINQVGCKGTAHYLCHECGRLLCDGPRCCYWGWDRAFIGRPIAYHCPECDHLGLVGRFFRWLIRLLNKLYAGIAALLQGFKKYILTPLFKPVRFVFKRDRDKQKPSKAGV